jgi:hypothetical protein
MIRVLHARTGETLRHARSRRPAIEASTASELLQRLRDPESWNGLNAAEIDAVRQAVTGLTAREPVNILIAGGGSIFRIEKPDPEALAGEAAVRGEPLAWLSAERDAPVLVVFPGAEPQLERATDALRFLGYAARAVIAAGSTDVAAEVAASDPVALVVHASLLADGRLQDLRARWSPHALLGLLTESTSPPPGVDAALALPLRIEAVATLLDPLIARARARRIAQ